MKKFVLQSISLISIAEKKAKKVVFDPKRTIIFGKNDTGKSSLIKSIYKTFGAEPHKENPKWKKVGATSFVRFSLDNNNYSILRDGRLYAIFDSKGDIINISNGATKELAPFLAELFQFKIKLPHSKTGELITPPPAFLFLPYYVDQDSGWQKNWESFNGLRTIKGYRDPIINYHTGLRPNEYYEAKGEVNAYVAQIDEIERERKLSMSILKRLEEKLADIDFSLSIEDFQEEIKELLVQCQELKKKQDTHKAKLVEFYNMKVAVEAQITIAKQAMNEAKKDFAFATYDVEEDIDCPTCGTHFENSFAERLAIAEDEGKCRELLGDFYKASRDLEDSIQNENDAFKKNTEEIIRIEEILAKRKEQIQLKDLIDSAGKKELKSLFKENINSLLDEITDKARQQKILEDKLKELEDKDRRESILGDYRNYMRSYLRQLDLHNISEDDYKSITTSIPNTGSALPRTLMAYYFSIFQVMKKYSTTTFCPIVIDSPNQQAQDTGHIDKILNFIKENQPKDTQLILGLEELYGVDFECPIIELKHKYSLLKEDQFDEVDAEIAPYFDKVYNSGATGRLF